MSDDNENPPEVGYGNPPVEHRFPKGKSGNPRGRPRKVERTFFPDQHVRDTLAQAIRPVRVKLRGKETEVSSYEAALMKLRAKALEGHGPSLREYLRRSDNAMLEFYRHNKQVMEIYEMLDRHLRSELDRTGKGHAIDTLNAISKGINKIIGS